MNKLCEVSTTGRGIHFDSKKAADTFLGKLEVGVMNGLKVHPGGDRVEVSGTLMCLGYRHLQIQGANQTLNDSKVCLLNLLRAEGQIDKFTVQGSCPQEGELPEMKPVEHEGYLLDYRRLTIRDKKGRDVEVQFSALKVFSLLSHSLLSFDELVKAYNADPSTVREISRETLTRYIHQLETKMGKDVIQITEDRQIMLRKDDTP